MDYQLRCESCGNEDVDEFSITTQLYRSYNIIEETGISLLVRLDAHEEEGSGDYICTCLLCDSEVEINKNLEFI